MVGIAVTVVYQGNFELEAYRLGRLAAGLYRMPPSFGEAEGPGGMKDDSDLPQVCSKVNFASSKPPHPAEGLFLVQNFDCRQSLAVCMHIRRGSTREENAELFSR